MILAAGAGWAFWKCPCTTALGVPGVKVSEHRERSGAFQPARTIRLRRQRRLRTLLIHSLPWKVDAKARLVRIQLLSAQ
jgi:hypothetical protein